MYWESKGLIFNSSKLIKSIKSHAWVPPHIKSVKVFIRFFMPAEINLIIVIYIASIFLWIKKYLSIQRHRF